MYAALSNRTLSNGKPHLKRLKQVKPLYPTAKAGGIYGLTFKVWQLIIVSPL